MDAPYSAMVDLPALPSVGHSEDVALADPDPIAAADSTSSMPTSSSSTLLSSSHVDKLPSTSLLSSTDDHEPIKPPQSASLPHTTAIPQSMTLHSCSSHRCVTSLPSFSAATYDSLLELAGVGPFHYQLLLLCGWANAADAVEILAASFIIYAAKDDLVLTDSEKGWIGAMVFLGMLVGGWVWGSLADRLGRKTCLMLALLLNSVGGIMAAFVGSYHGMLICRFIAGLGVGGSIPVIFTYFIEFLPTSHRGQYMVYLAWFWMVGAIFTAALAWIIIPIDMSSSSFILTPFHSWRLFTLLCALPSLLCSVLLVWCPESPRFLLAQRKVPQAKLILSEMFAINHPALFGGVGMRAEWCGLCCGVEVRSEGYNEIGQDEVDPMVERKDGEVDEEKGLTGDVKAEFQKELAGLALEGADDLTVPSYSDELRSIVNKTVSLFQGPSLSHSLKLMIVWFGLSFGYYGITLWIPETFSHLNPTASSVLDPYSAAFLSAACNLPGNLLSVYTVRTLGRTMTLSSSIAASTLAVLLVPLGSGSAWSVVGVLSVFTLVSVGAWNALNICTTELYDTGVRSTAFGVMAAVGRMGAILGNVLLGELIGGSVWVPMLVTAGFMLLSAIAAWRLKETKDEVLT